MSVTIATLDVQIFTSLRAFLLGVLPSAVEVFRAQINRVPEPMGLNFVVMTEIGRRRIGTDVETWTTLAAGNPLNAIAVEQSTDVMIQLDVHGPAGADNAQIISTLMRNNYGCVLFANAGYGVQPLEADDPKQVPFINGEQQYEDRWIVIARMQANPVVTIGQPFADTLDINIFDEADGPVTLSGNSLIEPYTDTSGGFFTS